MQQNKWGRVIIITILTVYTFCVLSNLISYRQVQYNITEPLPDISTQAQNVWPNLDLVTALDVIAASNAAFTFIIWLCCSRRTRPLMRFVATQAILLPFMGFSQWSTVIPDALPGCIDRLGIPRGDDIGWIWWKMFSRPCGDVYWASDIAQIVLWGSFGVQSMHNDFMICVYAIVTIVAIGLALAARYQYTSGVLITLLITVGASTHPFFDWLGRVLFTKTVRERASSEEVMKLNLEL